MRATLTIVLQILVDSDHLDDMRGSIQCINEEQEPLIFHSEAELFDQLKRLVAEKGKASGIDAGGNLEELL